MRPDQRRADQTSVERCVPRTRLRARAYREPDYELEQTGPIICSPFLRPLLGRGLLMRGLHLLVDNLARIPRIGRERRQVLVNSAHLRADTHVCNGASGGWWKEAKADVVGVIKILTIKITRSACTFNSH